MYEALIGSDWFYHLAQLPAGRHHSAPAETMLVGIVYRLLLLAVSCLCGKEVDTVSPIVCTLTFGMNMDKIAGRSWGQDVKHLICLTVQHSASYFCDKRLLP